MPHGAAKNDDDDDAAAAAAAGIWDPGWTQGRPSCISKWSKLRRLFHPEDRIPEEPTLCSGQLLALSDLCRSPALGTRDIAAKTDEEEVR